MGLTKVRVVVRSTETGASREIELIVDTGSVFTWLVEVFSRSLG
jgi:hypothetical protein